MREGLGRFPWTRVMLSGYLVGCVAVGVLGLVEPPSGAFVVDGSQWLYSGVMVLFGLVGLVAVPHHPQVVVRAVWTIAAATLIHGVLAWVEGSPLAGLRLAIAPLMMVPAIWGWAQWMMVVKQIHLRRREDERDE